MQQFYKGEIVRSQRTNWPTLQNEHARVLIVEDDGEAREALHMLLALQGFDVAVAADGAEGLRLASGFQPHLVLLDISMPLMDGFDVARMLRDMSFASRPRLVALTALTAPADIQHAFDAGFDEYCAKPVEPARIYSIVNRHADALGLKRRNRPATN